MWIEAINCPDRNPTPKAFQHRSHLGELPNRDTLGALNFQVAGTETPPRPMTISAKMGRGLLDGRSEKLSPNTFCAYSSDLLLSIDDLFSGRNAEQFWFPHGQFLLTELVIDRNLNGFCVALIVIML